MRTLGLAVVVLALCVPTVEAKPLSAHKARKGVAAYLARDIRKGKATHGSIGRCVRASRRVIDCKLWEYGLPPDDDLGSTEGWFWVRVRLVEARWRAYARDFIDLPLDARHEQPRG